jgi:asparagine synthase (glutamine-hydrolysing)
MTDVMTHRGPDDRGTFVEAGVALGVRRLSIVDVEGGHQPVSSEDGSVRAVQNGELYNHRALRELLAPDRHRFRSECDTEVLPHLYERFGVGFARQLRGMFGIAVWDGRRRRAVLVRDRLGIKPLYVGRAGEFLVFGSELKSVLASGLVATELDYEAIESFLTFGFFPGPRTPLAAVSKLMPGHYLVVEDGEVTIEQYWSYPVPSSARPLVSVDSAAEGLVEELDTAVRLHLMADVPLGAMLSGGIDSSLIVALMARNMSEPVKTFSVGFAGAPEANELADARLVANAFGTDHHELELSLTDERVDIEDLVWHLDEPLADLSAIGFHALCELATQHVTVALSGQGADELFGGYDKHRAAALTGIWRSALGPAAPMASRLALRGPTRFRRAARTLAARDGADRLLAMSGRLDPDVRTQLFRGPLAETDGQAARRTVLALLDGVPDDPLPTTLYIDGQLALVDDMLHYFDRTSMAHSLEVRVPFLDHPLVEFSASVPGRMKVRRLTTKYLLKRVASGLIPEQIIDKPKIGLFNAAVDSWFDAQAQQAIERYLLQPDPAYAEILNPVEVRAMVQRHAAAPSKRAGQLLLSILMLEVWLTSFLPRATDMSGRPATAVF